MLIFSQCQLATFVYSLSTPFVLGNTVNKIKITILLVLSPLLKEMSCIVVRAVYQ